ncbi:MAG: DUF512 domain-containing protein [Clostridiales bacterium]|jgi:putative radical SAM enzyme (TIGR03279 family)|nr:DUF512 domain-containing protein [Clostridiales bacterium]
MPVITGFERNSVLKKYGFKKGDEIIAFDGFKYTDYLDYIFYDAKDGFTVTAARGGERFTKRIEKSGGQSMGANFDGEEIEPVSCRNKCVFCFVDQMRRGMRETLYVKDDDYRLSFISGNYITMTNLSQCEIERIKRLRLSPLYISVHAFDGAVRAKMLGNRFAGGLFGILKDLGGAGVFFHTQTVLVEGVNDGKILEETVAELFKLPCVLSVAIVPVGLTRFREGLSDIKPLSAACIGRTISFAERFAAYAREERGTAFVWCGDEMYIKAGKELPPAEYYEDFCQIENGIGLAPRFIRGVREAIGDFINYGVENGASGGINDGAETKKGGADGSAKKSINDNTNGDINNAENAETKKLKTVKIEAVTGVSFYGVMKELAAFIEEKVGFIGIKVTKIINNFFGETVTVAGLITGADIAAQFKPDCGTDYVLIPKTMLKEFENVFLDGMSVDELSRILMKKVLVSPSDGYEFAELLLSLRSYGV